MPRRSRGEGLAAASALVLGSLAPPGYAQAASDPPVELSVTDTASVVYNADNRNSRPGQVASLVDDDWGAVYNHLDLQAGRGPFRLWFRLDSAWFYESQHPGQIGIDLVGLRDPAPGAESDGSYFRRKLRETGVERSNRYVNWTYPAKYRLEYDDGATRLVVGDFYAQFGRGLVLSARKVDELSSDNTIRGVRATHEHRLERRSRLRLTLLGGEMNPLRIDDASGRYVGVAPRELSGFFRVSQAGMPVAVGTQFVAAEPHLRPDGVLGAELRTTLPGVALGTHVVTLSRQGTLATDHVRSAEEITNLGQSLELPRLGSIADGYLEAAMQRMSGIEAELASRYGYALYAALGLRPDPLVLLVEAKHYRAFYPLRANVDTARAREFTSLQYSRPPTTLPVWADYEAGEMNTCVSGGRARADLRVAAAVSVYTWVGHYWSWAESVANERCEIDDDHLSRAWDLALGGRVGWLSHQGEADVTVGLRRDDADREIATVDGTRTRELYRERYLRYDVLHPLTRHIALQLQGWHRWRAQTLGGPNEPWFEGDHATGFQWLSRLTTAIGVEYDTDPRTPLGYVNASASVRATDELDVAVFAGQRRGSLRCVSGVCRVFPPFEGARLDATLRL